MATIRRRVLFTFMKDKSINNPDILPTLQDYVHKCILLNTDNIQDNYKLIIKRWLSKFIFIIRNKWKKCNRTLDKFLKENNAWLDTEIKLPDRPSVSSTSSEVGGRPRKSFEKCGPSGKRQKVANLRKIASTSELIHAAKLSVRSEGNDAGAKIIEEALETSPTRAKKIKDALRNSTFSQNPVSLTTEEAVSLLVELNLSKQQYVKLRLIAKEHNADIFPSYEKLLKAKQECYPEKESFIIGESIGEIKLQNLLDHTAKRIVKLKQSDIVSIPSDITTFELISKWGFDGSSSHSNYKQKFQNSELDDNCMFLTSFVPLKLTYFDLMTKQQQIIWSNPVPSSTRYCRPIRFQIKKETTALSLAEKQYIDDQIKSLIPTVCTVSNEKNINVSHQLVFTMIDGKVCSAITGLSVQRCSICGAYPSEMNKLDLVRAKNIDNTTLEYSIPVLHAHIRYISMLLL